MNTTGFCGKGLNGGKSEDPPSSHNPRFPNKISKNTKIAIVLKKCLR